MARIVNGRKGQEGKNNRNAQRNHTTCKGEIQPKEDKVTASNISERLACLR